MWRHDYYLPSIKGSRYRIWTTRWRHYDWAADREMSQSRRRGPRSLWRWWYFYWWYGRWGIRWSEGGEVTTTDRVPPCREVESICVSNHQLDFNDVIQIQLTHAICSKLISAVDNYFSNQRVTQRIVPKGHKHTTHLLPGWSGRVARSTTGRWGRWGRWGTWGTWWGRAFTLWSGLGFLRTLWPWSEGGRG